MQTSIQRTGSLAGGVELRSENQPWVSSFFKFSEYLCDDYCFSCAYFRQARGHFGSCLEDPGRGTYDGAKKGSACAGWRVRSAWIDEDYSPSAVPTPVRRRPVRLTRKELGKFAVQMETLGSLLGPCASGSSFAGTQSRLKKLRLLYLGERKRIGERPKETVQKALALVQAGWSLRRAGREVGASPCTVRLWMQKAGLEAHVWKRSSETVEKALALFQERKSVASSRSARPRPMAGGRSSDAKGRFRCPNSAALEVAPRQGDSFEFRRGPADRGLSRLPCRRVRPFAQTRFICHEPRTDDLPEVRQAQLGALCDERRQEVRPDLRLPGVSAPGRPEKDPEEVHCEAFRPRQSEARRPL
jgi:hypothetical protein